jgi:hypothetical protein
MIDEFSGFYITSILPSRSNFESTLGGGLGELGVG